MYGFSLLPIRQGLGSASRARRFDTRVYWVTQVRHRNRMKVCRMFRTATRNFLPLEIS